MSTEVYTAFEESQETKRIKLIANNKQVLSKKLSQLKENHLSLVDSFKNSVTNLTGTQIPKEVAFILSLGPKFSLPVDNEKIPLQELLADVEGILDTKEIQDEQKLSIRNEVAVSVNHFLKQKDQPDQIKKEIKSSFIKTKKFLRENEDILVLNTDKGSGTVLMPKEAYAQKMEDLLGDTSTYITIDNDPTSFLVNKNKRLANQLYEKHYIEENTRNKLLNDVATSPKIYGLVKVHKNNNPLRPVVSNINSPCYKLAKFVAEILKCLTIESKFNIKNSFECKKKLDSIEIPNERELISFDVKSLFTNVPIDLACTIIRKKHEILSNNTKIDIDSFMEMVTFCVDENNYFQYQNRFFKQRYGLAMGNPLSPILSDIVLEDLFETVKLPYTPTFLFKYVDDIITDVPVLEINNTLKALHTFHPKIEFTIERENNASVPFLDMLVIRTGNKIITDWYTKPTASNRILNYHSQHPFNMKKNVANNLLKRAIDLSDKSFHHKNVIKASEILRSNQYPDRLIKNSIKRSKHTNLITATVVDQVQTSTQTFCSVKYIPKLSEKIKCITKSLNTKIAFKPINQLNEIFSKTKDRVADTEKSGLVYKINCKPPCNKYYIGQTSKKLSKRTSEHKNDYKNIIMNNCQDPELKTKIKNKIIKRKDVDIKQLKYVERDQPKYTGQTALVSHGLEKFREGDNDHFDFSNVEILKIEKCKPKREFLESSEIYKNKNSINIKTDLRKVSDVYFPLLKKYFTK